LFAATDPRKADEELRRIYEEAALLVMDGGLTWSEYWTTPRAYLDQYKKALSEREDKIRKKAKRGRR